MKRHICEITSTRAAVDGAGVKIERIAMMNRPLADPFLLLDEIRSDDPDDYIAGFPPHPHRGMETLTYIRKGGIRHEDHLGNTGEVLSGGAQWMSAGKGVIHGEMPLTEDDQLHGFQLWINLSAQNKLKAPDYKDVSSDAIPVARAPGVQAKVLAGRWDFNGEIVEGPLNQLAADVAYIDLELSAGGTFIQPMLSGRQVIVYVYEGQLESDRSILAQQMATFSSEGELELKSVNGARALVLHGQPHGEPIAHYGPFVMNTMAEIEQAIEDYQTGRLVD